MNATVDLSFQETQFYELFLEVLPSTSFLVVAVFFDFLAGVMTMNVLFKNPIYKSNTFTLIKLLLINYAFLSSLVLCFDTFKIVSGLLKTPIFFKQYFCFALTGWELFFLRNNAIMTLIISIDRLKSTINPQITISEKKSQSHILLWYQLGSYLALRFKLQTYHLIISPI